MIVGTPLSDLTPLYAAPTHKRMDVNQTSKVKETGSSLSSPVTITFVRSRTLYARPALNAKGKVTFGLRHIRATPRLPSSKILISARCP